MDQSFQSVLHVAVLGSATRAFVSGGRKVFLFEQLLYSPDDLRRHHEDGDTPAILGEGPSKNAAARGI